MSDLGYYVEIASIVRERRTILDSLLKEIEKFAPEIGVAKNKKYIVSTAQINGIQFVLYPNEKKYITLGNRLMDIKRGRVHEHHVVLLLAWFYTYHPKPADDWHTHIKAKLADRAGRKPVYSKRPEISDKRDFKRLFKKKKDVAEKLPKEGVCPQPILSIPIAPEFEHRLTYYYSHRALPVIGRDEEQIILRRFAGKSSQAGFEWMQLAGEGGQGKSRLSLELAYGLKDTWNAGFISTPELEHFNDKWRDWNPDRATLIIVDYIIADMEYLKNLIYYLSFRKDEFEFPVRLLIVERQRWSEASASLNGVKSTTPRVNSDNNVADWFDQISGKTQQRDIIEIAKATPDVLVLEALGLTELTDLVKKWAKKVWDRNATYGRLSLQSDREIERHLDRIDETGRPLFAYFLGEALAHKQDVANWGFRDLLDTTLKRDIKYRWSRYFDGELLSFEDNHPAFHLAIIATMIRELDTRELCENFECSPKLRRQAMVITDSFIPYGVPDKNIQSLAPDILGEWLVISAISENRMPSKDLVDTAWRLSPNEMAAFVVRLSRDFFDHPGTDFILKLDVPNEIEVLETVLSIITTIASRYYGSSKEIPNNVHYFLDRASQFGDLEARMALGGLRRKGYFR